MLLLMPLHINGFDFRTKKWESLLIDRIREPKWNKKAFVQLMLPLPTKEMIKAMVLTQGKVTDSDDFIEGKGGALLTFTSVAELAERPLYRVTCGDIGTDADSMERYLETVLYLGKTWNCVILFDEADIYLEERSLYDIHRNSVVSVFLRILEYYEGIIILTSNRVGTFDEAFKSRIQIAIHYRDLSRADFEELNDRLDDLSELEMNGRQIRNAIAAAKRQALFLKQSLGWRHFDNVINIAGSFSKYLHGVHGHTDEDNARFQQRR
ncbi:hypothetical protein F5883DRAFT_680932 [Diaporthe sp. PMI_573]|nr:hypothetical protein F5883DRAFT_680932 [Diaporthaceae sp. PMI_573]